MRSIIPSPSLSFVVPPDVPLELSPSMYEQVLLPSGGSETGDNPWTVDGDDIHSSQDYMQIAPTRDPRNQTSESLSLGKFSYSGFAAASLSAVLGNHLKGVKVISCSGKRRSGSGSESGDSVSSKWRKIGSSDKSITNSDCDFVSDTIEGEEDVDDGEGGEGEDVIVEKEIEETGREADLNRLLWKRTTRSAKKLKSKWQSDSDEQEEVEKKKVEKKNCFVIRQSQIVSNGGGGGVIPLISLLFLLLLVTTSALPPVIRIGK